MTFSNSRRKLFLMSYEHFGKFADVWKHLSLCSVLDQGKPVRYVESNSAYATYELRETPEQRHGIYAFLANAGKVDLLRNQAYYQLESFTETVDGRLVYLGSPALAMRVLSGLATEFVFFDLDRQALESVAAYARTAAPTANVSFLSEDSRAGLNRLLSGLSGDDFLFLDPYEILEANEQGMDYLGVFLEAGVRGVPAALWYGYDSIEQKGHIAQLVQARRSETVRVFDTSVHLSCMEHNEYVPNPGVLGSGMAFVNIPRETEQLLSLLIDALTEVYADSMLYDRYSGALTPNVDGTGKRRR